ncbi:hypothetical protein CRYUN_Cryun03dG0031700 [Craigia yunnanensis]
MTPVDGIDPQTSEIQQQLGKVLMDYGVLVGNQMSGHGRALLAKKRRILWGWILESENTTDDIKKGWSGLQSIHRIILLRKTGKQLTQWPVEEIEKLRAKNVSFQNKELKGGSVLEVSGITASQGLWVPKITIFFLNICDVTRLHIFVHFLT